jgi:hypothetical protein
MDRSDRGRALRLGSLLAFALSALPADGAERIRLQDAYDQALKEVWPNGAPPIGSGFQVAPGKIVTASHVIAGCHAPWVRSSATSAVAAQVVALDTRVDIALLEAPAIADLPTLALGETETGARVTVFGFPKRRGTVARERVASPAIVDGAARSDTGGPLLVLRGSGIEGISGGPVVDGGGTVVGMIVAKQTGDDERLFAVSPIGIGDFLAYMAVEPRRSRSDPEPRPTQTNDVPRPPPLAPLRAQETPKPHKPAAKPAAKPATKALPKPVHIAVPRVRTATAGSGRGAGGDMPAWTGAVMQVGCSR